MEQLNQYILDQIAIALIDWASVVVNDDGSLTVKCAYAHIHIGSTDFAERAPRLLFGSSPRTYDRLPACRIKRESGSVLITDGDDRELCAIVTNHLADQRLQSLLLEAIKAAPEVVVTPL